jgi:Replication initiator protein A
MFSFLNSLLGIKNHNFWSKPMTSTRRKTKSPTIKPAPAKVPILKADEENTDLLPPDEIRSEVNFLNYPFFSLSRKDAQKRTKAEYHTTVNRGDERVEVSWIVSSNSRYGYPGPFDQQVFKAIEYIVSQMRPPIQNPVPIGSLYDIAKLLGLSWSGRTSKEIQASLTRIVTTSIDSKSTFYDKSKQRWIRDVFHLYDRVVFLGQTLPNGEIADTNYLVLSGWYLESVNARYVKPLDYTYYRSLKIPIASRLYELLGVKFKRSLFINYSYSKLCQLLPLTRYQYFAQAKRQLESAHQELIHTGFFDNVEWVKVNDSHDWLVNYYAGTRAKEEIQRWSKQGALPPPDDLELGQMPPASSTPQQAEEDNDVVVALQNFGISKKTAKRLAKTHPEQDVFEKLQLVQWLVDTKSPLVSKNPQGFLVKALDEGYLPNPPKGYKTATQRKEEAKRQEQEVEQQRQATEQFQKAREEAKRRLIKKHPPQSIAGTDHTTQSAWGKVLASLQEQVSSANFALLKDTLLLQVTDTAAHIGVPSAFTGVLLERKLPLEIKNAIKGVVGKDLDLQFVTANPE